MCYLQIIVCYCVAHKYHLWITQSDEKIGKFKYYLGFVQIYRCQLYQLCAKEKVH